MDLLNQIILYLSILPSVLLGFHIYNSDKVEKEPVSLIFRCIVGGVVSGIIVIIVSYIFGFNDFELSNNVNILVYSFILIAFIEELFKYIIFYFLCYRNREFNYMYDGIVYASFIALGFAVFEDILYISSSTDLLIALSRGIFTIPSHIFFSIFMGYYSGIAKHFKRYKNKKKEYINLVKAICIPIILHGFFDYCLFTGDILNIIFFIIFELILYITAFKKVKEVSCKDKHI